MSRARVPAGAPLCAAVRELLCEVGYDKMTMDAIAARAHMSKATLYRHWPGKPDLVAQVLRQQQAEDVAPADTGSLRGDLIELLAAAARCVVDEGPLIHALSFAMQTDPELAGIVRGQVYPEIHRHTEALLERRGAARRDQAAALRHALSRPRHGTADGEAPRTRPAARRRVPGPGLRRGSAPRPGPLKHPHPKGTTMTTTVSRPEAAEPSAAAPNPRRWLALTIIAIAQLMVVLDATIVNIALPACQTDLGITDAERQWVLTAYTLTFGGLLLLGGRIADYWGRKRTFIAGVDRLRGRVRARRPGLGRPERCSPPAACRARSARCSPRPAWPC